MESKRSRLIRLLFCLAVIHIKKHEKELLQRQLDNEKQVLKDLEKQYKVALKDIDEKLATLMGRADADMQHVIFQVDYQKALKTQIQAILEQLHANEFETISEYLANCYDDGFVGTIYSLNNQGVPLIIPIDQNAVIKAIQTESKISEKLYTRLGKDVTELRKNITAEITRGISTGMLYSEISRNIDNASNVGLNRAARITRTEGNRIQNKASMDALYKAKEKGCDPVKMWCAALDGDTRPSHRQVDGETRELDEKFSNGLRYPLDPQGSASEVVNCRCTLLKKPRWSLDESELHALKERAEYFGLDKTKDFEDFKKKYLKALEKNEKNDIIKSFNIGKSVGAATKNYPVKLPESKQHVKLAEGQKIEGTAFAGKGTDKEIRDRFRLESFYKHPASEWQKVSGKGVVVVDGKNKNAELHWYEAEGEIVEMKVKRFFT